MAKILIRCGSMQGGGAEKVLLEYLKYLEGTEHSVTLLLNIKYGRYLNMIPGSIDLRFISRHYSKGNSWPFTGLGKSWNVLKEKLIFRYPKLIDIFFVNTADYDLDIAFIQSMSPIAKYSKAKSKWLWSHSDPIAVTKHGGRKKIINQSFRYFDKIIFVSQTTKNKYLESYPDDFSEKAIVLYNPLNIKDIQRASNATESINSLNRHPNIEWSAVSFGRLSPEKGYNKLITAFAALRKSYPSSSLKIYGRGPLKEELANLIKNLNQQDYIFIEDFVSNPYPLINAADLLISSSEYEGFALTVAEALVLNTPVMATPTAGAVDLLENGIFGSLCKGFSMEALLEGLIKNRKSRAAADVLDDLKFSSDKVFQKFNNLLSDTL